MKLLKHLIGLATVLSVSVGHAQVKIALDGPPDVNKSGSYVWVNAFAKHLKANGLETRELPRGSVGGEAEIFDQVSTGLLEVSLSDVKSVAKIDPFIYGVRLPYIFDDVGHMDKALAKGDVYSRVNKQLAPTSTMLLALVPIGPQSGIITTKQSVRTPADMAKLRMRALDDAQIALYKAWGSTGTIVPWKEVPTGLQTGVIDGYLNTALIPVLFGQTDFVKHFTDAGVIIAQRAVMASKAWYDGLTAKQREAVGQAVEKANAANRAWVSMQSEKSLQALEEKGVSVVRLSKAEREPFRKLSQATYKSGLLSEEHVKFWTDVATATR
jgi:TRAP-type C4-dicarboxylate transport system substrate-binding protein